MNLIERFLEWLGLANNEDTSDFKSFVEESPKLPGNDKESTNIFVGKIIDDGSVKCEVVAHHNKNNMHVKILEIKWPRIGTYLDIGKIYPVFKHSGWGKDLEVWEISGKRMKRSTSQLILQWEKGRGWTWDLDM